MGSVLLNGLVCGCVGTAEMHIKLMPSQTVNTHGSVCLELSHVEEAALELAPVSFRTTRIKIKAAYKASYIYIFLTYLPENLIFL